MFVFRHTTLWLKVRPGNVDFISVFECNMIIVTKKLLPQTDSLQYVPLWIYCCDIYLRLIIIVNTYDDKGHNRSVLQV